MRPRVSRLQALVLLSSTLFVGLSPVESGYALPMERFESRLQIECGEGQRSCSGSIRDVDTLGRITGFSVVKSSSGRVALDVAAAKKAGMKLTAKDVADLSLTLSWDGDLNPDLLSGSGLNCFDLTRQGAYAFIISGASLRSECAPNGAVGGCPAFSTEARAYNASDPTGQKFSASVVTRALSEPSEIVIPFSNFIRHGLRGKGSFSCVGAVTVVFRFRGFSEIELVFGPIYTNGDEGLTPLPTATELVTATPTATPTASPSGTPTATPTLTAHPSFTVTVAPTITALETGVPSQTAATPSTAPVESVTAGPTADPAAPEAKLPEGSTTPAPKPARKRPEPEEAVYGEVVAE